MNRVGLIGVVCFSAGSAIAAMPLMGGPMSHVLVTVFDQQVYVSFESSAMSTVELQNYGESYTGSASVLDGRGYNAQFGWMANGFISLPPSAGIFVRTVHSSPWLDVYSEFGYDPILGTDESSEVWQWDGTMVHNWYASSVMGSHSVLYEVFVGDQFGQPLSGYGAGSIELGFTYGQEPGVMQYAVDDVVGVVPSPASAAAFGMVFLMGRRRR